MEQNNETKLEDLLQKLTEELVNNTKATYLLRREINTYKEFILNNMNI